MMAAFVYLSMWLADTSIKKRTTRRHTARWLGVAALLLAMFAVLTALNFFRNANFYREEGISNPLSMNLYQTAAYLAVPAQVSIGVADAIMTGAWEVRGDPLDSLQTIQPTFLQSNKVSKSAGKDPEFYGSAVSFMRSFRHEFGIRRHLCLLRSVGLALHDRFLLRSRRLPLWSTAALCGCYRRIERECWHTRTSRFGAPRCSTTAFSFSCYC